MSEYSELSVSDLTTLLVEACNKEVDEFNVLYDSHENLKTELSLLKNELNRLTGDVDKYKILEKQCHTIEANAEKHLQAIQQAYREKDQMKDKLDSANELLKSYKELGTPKKIREKFKNYQNKVASITSNLNNAKTTIKKYKTVLDKTEKEIVQYQLSETQHNMTSVWSSGGDNLMIFPAKLNMKVGDHQEKQLTLLFMTKSGCGKLIALDEEGQPAVCSTPEESVFPKEETLEKAGELLRKWKRLGWKIDVNDLNLNGR